MKNVLHILDLELWVLQVRVVNLFEFLDWVQSVFDVGVGEILKEVISHLFVVFEAERLFDCGDVLTGAEFELIKESSDFLLEDKYFMIEIVKWVEEGDNFLRVISGKRWVAFEYI